MSQHIVSPKIYFLIFAGLLALTALTTGAAFVDLGPFNTVVALMIAVTKAILVILFFMHVRYSPHLTRIVVVAGFFWLAILITLTLSDFRTRQWTPSPSGWETSTSSPHSTRRGGTVDSRTKDPLPRQAALQGRGRSVGSHGHAPTVPWVPARICGHHARLARANLPLSECPHVLLGDKSAQRS